MPVEPVRRRTVLGVGLAVVTLAGCDSGEDIAPPSAGASPSAGSTEAPEAPDQTPDQTPDQALVEEVATRLAGAGAVLVAARRFPPLKPSVQPLLRVHRDHLTVLEEDASADAVPAPVDAATALVAVRRSERELHAVLVEAAGRAESGALARLLASMSASTTQHLATLPREVTA